MSFVRLPCGVDGIVFVNPLLITAITLREPSGSYVECADRVYPVNESPDTILALLGQTQYTPIENHPLMGAFHPMTWPCQTCGYNKEIPKVGICSECAVQWRDAAVGVLKAGEKFITFADHHYKCACVLDEECPECNCGFSAFLDSLNKVRALKSTAEAPGATKEVEKYAIPETLIKDYPKPIRFLYETAYSAWHYSNSPNVWKESLHDALIDVYKQQLVDYMVDKPAVNGVVDREMIDDLMKGLAGGLPDINRSLEIFLTNFSSLKEDKATEIWMAFKALQECLTAEVGK